MPEKLSQGPRVGYDLAKTGVGLGRGPFKGKTLTAAPWSPSFPSPGATLDLDFANDRGYVRGVGQGRSMDAVTFTRASNGTFVKPDGTLSTHANQGALGNNLLTFPQDFDNAAWAKNGTTVTASSGLAPDGTNTASILNQTSATSTHDIIRNIASQVSGTTYILSVYLKKNTASLAQITLNGAAHGYVNFDLDTGSVVGFGNSPVDYGVQDADNGWYRCYAAITSSVNETNGGGFLLAFIQNAGDGRRPSFAGNTANSIYIWGAQLE
jgi:hypothetical protein